ncbi:spore germination protein [Brevibacillus migulae]|uniref:spore germination protein n=1 Tax=Brevibacillus migulae TaxID=1644114 RepID=UPI00106F06EA|nr:spore germination protein [Brevibacillus migulae]
MFGFRKKRSGRILKGNGDSKVRDEDSSRGQVFSSQLKENLALLAARFQGAQDFTIREFDCFGKFPACVLYLSSLVDKEMIASHVVKPLMYAPNHMPMQQDSFQQAKPLIRQVLFDADGKAENQVSIALDLLLRGSAVILLDGMTEAIIVNVQKVEKRGIEQPKSEQVIRGPRDGFIEHLQTNLALLRVRIPSVDLKIKVMQIGTITKSQVAIVYMDGITEPTLIQDIEERLNAIQIDRILDAGYIEQFIQDNPWSPFPQIRSTERPDVAVGNLLEGRVALLVDGSPYALICPTTFAMFYQTAEDYTERTLIMSLTRMVRVIALLFSLITPSLYIAVLSFHPELIPTKFAIAVASGRAGVPFPTFLEVFMMEAAVEILREATVRMPQQIGGALSIVGVLVIGQAAVMAGFVSPITVVVIALTTISSFATPAYNAAMAFRMLRFPIMLATGAFGFFGLIGALFLVNNHIISLKSFGVPFFTPFSPMNFGELKDTIIRAPLRHLLDRPEELHPLNQRRLKSYGKDLPNNPLDPPMKAGERP